MPLGCMIVLGTSDKKLLLWSLVENKIIHNLKGSGQVATCLVLSRPKLISAGDTCVHVWCIRKAVILYKLDTQQAWLSCLVVNKGQIKN